MNFTIEHLKKSYATKEVLKDITFTFKPGHIYALLGRNGAGKTTLFNCINGDIDTSGGTWYLSDENGNKRDLLPEDLGYVISEPMVPEFLTGREFVKFYIDVNKKHIKNLRSIDEYLASVAISPEDSNRLMKEYSHGMRNKMQMLINFISEPPVLLLDEPLTSLDVVVAEEMKDILRSMKGDSIILLSTHIMDLALDLCDEIVLLNHGVLTALSRDELGTEDFRARIIEALKEEG
ncbi:MAG: ABC transporter ATP-binding protein [Lachnospiraceae bacterium]|nr:ABC transporter ATP-binding protein [Lachnospiraceae bacterium]